jgi:hypothetical protein
MKQFTAKEFHKYPTTVYRTADKEGSVIINHDRYDDVIFELSARERRVGLDQEVEQETSD